MTAPRARTDLRWFADFFRFVAPQEFDVEHAELYRDVMDDVLHEVNAERRTRRAAQFISWAAEEGHLGVDAFAFARRNRRRDQTAALSLNQAEPWQAVLSAYREHLANSGHTPATQRVYLQAPTALAGFLPRTTIAELTVADVHGFFTHLAVRLSPTGLPVMRRRTAALFDWAVQEGLATTNVGRIALQQTHRTVRPMTPAWQRATQAFHEHLAAAGAVEGTMRQRLAHLRRLADAVAGKDPFKVTGEDLARFVGAGNLKPESRKGIRTSVSTFYGWAHRVGKMQRNPAADLPGIRIPRARPRPVPEDVLDGALAAADARLRLMILLGACSGLRAEEIASLDVGDLDFFEQEMHVTGKGNVQRMVPMHPLVRTELTRWLQGRHGAVFPGQVEGHLASGTVCRLLSRALGPGWTGHKLRHRFASVGFQATRDLRAMQELLGHASPTTTAIYTAVSDASLRETVMAAGIGEGPRAVRTAGRF